MHLGVVLATETEAQGILGQVRQGQLPGNLGKWSAHICGMGILAHSLELHKLHTDHPMDAWLQVGICGAYPSTTLALGRVVEIQKDVLADFGAWSAEDQFLNADKLGWPAAYQYHANITESILPLRAFVQPSAVVRGCTVQSCTGTITMASIRSQLGEVETMEGASFFAVAQALRMPSWQVRGVSNIATTRNMDAWDMPTASRNLHTTLASLLMGIQT